MDYWYTRIVQLVAEQKLLFILPGRLDSCLVASCTCPDPRHIRRGPIDDFLSQWLAEFPRKLCSYGTRQRRGDYFYQDDHYN